MAGINRLTYFFYAYKEEVGNNKLRYTTNFPFIADQQLLISRPVGRTDIVSLTGAFDANPDLEELNNIVSVSNFGSYNSQNWFLGLSINGIVIYDGLFKVPNGISANFVNLNGQNVGVLEVDFNVFNVEFGLLDNVEIVIISAQTWTPWLYYGYDYGQDIGQARAFLLKNIDNGSWRVPTNMGGIFSSLVPAQAIQMRHFTNVDLSELFVPVVIPFPSAFIVGAIGAASSSNNVFHTADVIDGNGELKLRSSVKFNISSQSLTISTGGGFIAAATRTIIRADAYRTLNSKKLDYISSTFEERKILKDTDYYICFEKNLKYKSIYESIAYSLNLIVKRFIDTDEENIPSFTFLGFDESSIDIIQSKTENLQVASETLINIFNDDNFYTFNPDEDGELEEDNLGWNNLNMKLLVNYLNNNTSNTEKTPSILVLSGMNLSDDDLNETTNALTSLSDSNVLGLFLKHNSIQLNNVFSNRKSRGELIFGNSYKGLEEGSFPGFQLLNTLYILIGGSFSSEEDLYEESSMEFENGINLSGINSDVLISQSQNMVSLAVGSASQDFDGDGTISLIDRIYSLYEGFDRNNLIIGDDFFGFFGDFGSEMRYWRKVCPHGQNYKITGKVTSALADSAGNYILEVLPVWKDNDGNLYEPSQTTISVFVENSVRSNVSYQNLDDVVLEFQGRLFYPSYITKLGISPVISLNDIDELTAWYRLSRTTATKFIEEAEGIWKDKPVLFCRSNLERVDASTESLGLISVPQLFIGVENQFDSQYTPSFFKISQLVEYVGDHVYNLDFEEIESVNIEVNQEKTIFNTTQELSQENGGIEGETVPISFYEIEFDVEVSGNTDDFYKYEAEVVYKPLGQEDSIPIYKFYSAICFDSIQDEGPFKGKVKFSAADPIRLYCRPAPSEFITSEDLSGRLYHIDMPFREIQNFRYAYSFDKNFWDASLILNDRKVSALVIDDVNSFGVFGSEFSQINPFTGQILFRNEIDPNKNSVGIVFEHKNNLKIGNQLSVRVVNGSSVGGITISNVSVNFFSSPSIERTEGEYSSTLYGENYHLICPTQGFVSASGNSWFFDQDEETSDSLNFVPGSLNVVGNLVSPFLYFDAFANPSDITNKTIRMGNNLSDFPIIDIPHTTIAVNTSGAPFTEVRTIGYVPPEPDAQTKIDSVFDKGMRKFSIIYNINNILNMKYSFTKFKDFDSNDNDFNFINKSLRRTIPIYTGPLSLVEKSIDSDGIISISETARTAVGLELNTDAVFSETFEEETGVFFLQGSSESGFSSFGYIDGSGSKHTLLVPVYNRASSNNSLGYIQIPYAQGIDRIKINAKGGTNTGNLNKVNVQYLDNDNFINGVSGDIELFKTGDYVIFYFSEDANNIGINQIVGILSSKDGQFWKRPGIDDLNSSDSYRPIPILSNFSHPLLLSNEANDMMFLFVFGNLDNSVNLVHITRSMFMKLANGIGEDSSYSPPENAGEGDPSIEEPENSRSNIMRDPDKKSWDEYFGGTGNHTLPIVFNSTNIFSAALSERGVIYFVSKSLDNEMRLRINFSEGGTEYQPGGWNDIGVDFFDEEGFLGKALQNSEIYAIVLSYDSDMEGLHLFISTNNKLYVYRISGALLREKSSLVDDTGINELYQELANENKPVLIVGTQNEVSQENVDTNGIALEENFFPQQVSVNWTENGECWLFFTEENGNLKCAKSSSDGKTWKIDENV